jgi:hypothetical protein
MAEMAALTDCGVRGETLKGNQGVVLRPFEGRYGNGDYASIIYQAPWYTTLRGATLYRSLTTDSANQYGSLAVRQYAGWLDWAAPRGEDTGDWRSAWMNRGSVWEPFDQANRVNVTFAQNRFSVAVTCEPANPENGDTCTVAPSQLTYRIYGGKIFLHDDRDPTVESTTGSMLSDARLVGNEDLTLSASDDGSGLYRVRVLVDGAVRDSRVVESNGGACADVNPANGDDYEFASDRPCAASTDGRFLFDTTKLPDGVHEVVVQIEDASGNLVALAPARTVTIANAAPAAPAAPVTSPQMPAAPAANAAPTSLPSPGVAVRNGTTASGRPCPGDRVALSVPRRSVSLAHGARATLTARLACVTTDEPLINADLDVESRVRNRVAALPKVRTDSRGQARVRLAPGSSRSVRLGYRLSPGARTSAQGVVEVKVRSKIAFSITPRQTRNGRRIVLAGRLLGGQVPRRGVSLTAQYRDGQKWRPFRELRTDARGRFRLAYRFTRTRRDARYVLRVNLTRGQLDYPYEPTASRAITVRVAP